MITNSQGLSPEQSVAFIEVIEASLRITQREHFFAFLQGSLQYLIAHEVMVCGIRHGKDDGFRFESFASTRYFSDRHAEMATQANEGVVWRTMDAWRKSCRPVLLADNMAAGDHGSYWVPFVELDGALHQTELRNIAAHGVMNESGISTFFCFSRVPQGLTRNHAYILELLVPHLHSAFIRIFREADGSQAGSKSNGETCLVTQREREILEWVNKGKTNWEIANILEISPMTVKNHVQNILRKLDVQNRGHAAAKATKLGLVKA